MRDLNINKILAILGVIVIPLAVIFSKDHQTAYADANFSTVTIVANDLNVRQAPNHISKIVGLVHLGETFKTIQSNNNWDEIRLSNNQTGWVSNAYLTPTVNIEATTEAIVLNVRNSPSLTSRIIDKLKLGTKITVEAEHAGWAKMITSSGVQGWVYEYYINKDTSPPTHSSIVNTSSEGMRMDKAESTDTTEKNVGQSSESSPISDGHMTTESIMNKQDPFKGKTIVLDPGHGGKDDGTTSIIGTHEKSLTLLTAEAVEQKLENAGANVIMTRTNDTFIPLQQRANLSNENHADIFISFHYNWANDPLMNGLTDFYYQSSKDKLLAEDILNEVVKTTGLNNEGTRFDNLEVLRNNSEPSTLIELGFLSNKQDDLVVESTAYFNNVAQGVYLGLLNYFSK